MEGNLGAGPRCEVCGEPYETVRPSQQLYCSRSCKNKAAIKRRDLKVQQDFAAKYTEWLKDQ